MNKCETCRYYYHRPISDGDRAILAMFGTSIKGLSQCRRYVPTTNGWPHTYRTAWCGEWAEKQDDH